MPAARKTTTPKTTTSPPADPAGGASDHISPYPSAGIEPGSAQAFARLAEAHRIYRIPPKEMVGTKKETWKDKKGEWQTMENDYLGHASATDIFLRIDPGWSWAPMALDDRGNPLTLRDADANPRAMWITLTLLGVTRPGVGTVKVNCRDPYKELIGDALRNAAMRFGIATALWSKEEWGEIHIDQAEAEFSPPIGTGIRVNRPIAAPITYPSNATVQGGTNASGTIPAKPVEVHIYPEGQFHHHEGDNGTVSKPIGDDGLCDACRPPDAPGDPAWDDPGAASAPAAPTTPEPAAPAPATDDGSAPAPTIQAIREMIAALSSPGARAYAKYRREAKLPPKVEDLTYTQAVDLSDFLEALPA